ncbi:MAG: nicotinate-nucleotide adenylyltransferase [Legionella sp.]|uniref:nicotinate-nucleotide adenylyltransferase n=1 Tax=Legionella sp. TaxID=459 RepID=UPI0039E3963C
MYTIAIFGGTFDPIHNGHLQTSLAIQKEFRFDSYLFLPCKIPALKPLAHTTNQQRVHMLELALKDYPCFKIDLREIERHTPSYMIETLESFRKEFPEAAITLIMGYDSFLSLPQWHKWQKLICLANILVMSRLEFITEKTSEVMHQFLKKYQTQNQTVILNQKAGSVFLFDAGHYEISSTKIRKAIHDKQDLAWQLPKEVDQYIKDEGLY